MKKRNGLKERKKIEIGDLIEWKAPLFVGASPLWRGITGVVVGTTLDHPPNSQGDEPPGYWVTVVFLDGNKSILFHDEAKVLVKNGSR